MAHEKIFFLLDSCTGENENMETCFSTRKGLQKPQRKLWIPEMFDLLNTRTNEETAGSWRCLFYSTATQEPMRKSLFTLLEAKTPTPPYR